MLNTSHVADSSEIHFSSPFVDTFSFFRGIDTLEDAPRCKTTISQPHHFRRLWCIEGFVARQVCTGLSLVRCMLASR